LHALNFYFSQDDHKKIRLLTPPVFAHVDASLTIVLLRPTVDVHMPLT